MFDYGRDHSHTLCPWSAHNFLPKLLLTVLLTSFLLVAYGNVVAQANQVPVAAYSFDEGSGTIVKDSAGNHDGTINGATWVTAGKYGSALDFDGVNDLVSIANAADLDFTSSFTLEAWVRPDTLAQGRSVISKVETPATPSGYLLSAQVNGKPTGYASSSGTVKGVSGTTALSTGTWTDLAFTSDGTTLRLYVEGKLASTAPAIAAKATTAGLEIGHSVYFNNVYFDGLIDEVRIYNQALPESQIQADRDTAVGLDQMPVAAYSFDEGSGTIVKDSAGNHDGAISGASWASGKYGSALNFDGVNDLVSVANAADLVLTKTFTIEAWVNPTSTAASRPVVSKGETTGGNSGYALSARYTSTPPAGIAASAGTQKTVASPSALKPGEWAHLAVTSDGTTMRLYVNGHLTANAPTISAKATNAALEIGHSFLGGYFQGLIDEVRIYSETLSESQIQTDRDNPVPPAPQEVTTAVLDTGTSSEKVSNVPITANGTETIVYSLTIPSIKAEETLRATGNLEVTNTHTYDVTDSVRLVLGSNASDAGGTVVTPWTKVQHTPDMYDWTLPIGGAYHAASNLGTQYLKLIIKASSPVAKEGDTLIVQPNYGRLALTRYTPATGPMAQPTHQLQPLVGPMTERTTSIPVDSTWQLVLSRKVGDLSVNDILDISGQLEVQNTNSVPIQLESIIKMAPSPTTTSSWASPTFIDRLVPGMNFDRAVHSNTVKIVDPGKSYLNLLVRAVPVSGTPSPLTVTQGSGSLDVLHFKPSLGDPTAPLGEGTLENNPYWDDSPSLSSVPFSHYSAPELKVVNSTPIYSLRKGDVIRGRGVVTADLAGGNAAQVVAALLLADSPTATTGETVARFSGDSISTAEQVHTIFKEGTFVAPQTSNDPKYLNLVVHASRTPAYPGESMKVLGASVSYARSLPTKPFEADFEDGLLDQFQFSNAGTLSVSSNQARTGSKSMRIDVNSSSHLPSDPPGVLRALAVPPDQRAAGGYDGEDSWYGLSAYFPEGFNAPDPAPASHFSGQIDEVRLYDKTLSQTQILADKNAEYGKTGVAPVAAYTFDEGSGTTANDSTGNHNGAIKNATWTVDGKYGSALSFDGKDSEVSVPDAPELDFTNTFTLEAWVNPTTLANMVPAIAKSEGLSAGYGLAPSSLGNPGGFVAASGSAKSISGDTALSTGSWAHLALTSDGSTLRLYIDGQLVKTAPAINAAVSASNLTIGGPSLTPPTSGTWNIFAQLHHSNVGLDCLTELSPPISFNVRYRKAGSFQNPGASKTSTPVDGEYLEMGLGGGPINAGCNDTLNPFQTYVLAPLQHDHWYDFVLHTRWTTEEGTLGNSVSEVWLDGEQILGNQSIPISMPTLFWHGFPSIHNLDSQLSFGLYRGPSTEDPPSTLYIDSIKTGDSYSEVAPGQ
jgi:Concanavalin A-like lectin/glucanases superfamily